MASAASPFPDAAEVTEAAEVPAELLAELVAESIPLPRLHAA
jgi:hypothetical protein